MYIYLYIYILLLGSIDIEFNVSRSGYVPGEAIEITTVVKNRSRVSLLYCKAALRMVSGERGGEKSGERGAERCWE